MEEVTDDLLAIADDYQLTLIDPDDFDRRVNIILNRPTTLSDQAFRITELFEGEEDDLDRFNEEVYQYLGGEQADYEYEEPSRSSNIYGLAELEYSEEGYGGRGVIVPEPNLITEIESLASAYDLRPKLAPNELRPVTEAALRDSRTDEIEKAGDIAALYGANVHHPSLEEQSFIRDLTRL